VEFKRLEPSTALFALLSFPRVHGWERSEVLTRDFSRLTEVVNRVPIYAVTIPWGPPFGSDVTDALITFASKLAAIRRTDDHRFPTGDIEQILDEIERGYLDDDGDR
jgi:hypothetical protein